jgi:hypothetical protein
MRAARATSSSSGKTASVASPGSADGREMSWKPASLALSPLA